MGILHGAARHGDLVAVNAELTRGTNVNTPDKHGRRALALAAGSGHIQVVRTLLQAGAEVNGCHIGGSEALSGEMGWTPLMAASRGGRTEIAALLLKTGADVNARNSQGETALMQAISSGSVETVRLLLEHGADPKAHTGNQSVWEWAKEEEQDHDNAFEILTILQQAGATT